MDKKETREYEIYQTKHHSFLEKWKIIFENIFYLASLYRFEIHIGT